MTVAKIIASRGINEILHFTTNHGLTGVVAADAVKPRKSLSSDKYLEHIYKANCEDRSRDADWHGYINLSIGRINSHLFGISSGKWHRDIDGWWCILSFTPDVLTHPGVFFATTNNMYTGCKRAEGADGLLSLFGPKIVRWSGNTVTRRSDAPLSHPTCPQAEVLYPGELSLTYLRRIYVKEEAHADDISGMFAATGRKPVECIVDPAQFS